MFGKKNVKMTIVVITTLLFFLLSPGVIVTLPPTPDDKDKDKDCGAFFMLAHNKNGCATNWQAVFLHSLLFGLLVYVLIEATMGNIRSNIFKKITRM
jgi:hypothetical protein